MPSPFGTLSGTAMFGPNLDFTFYRLFVNGNTDKPVYIIGGNATPEAKLIGTGTQGDVQRYKLGQDIIQQIDIPFVTGDADGTLKNVLKNVASGAFVSDLYLVRPDGVRYDAAPGTTDTPVALQASFQIDGSGASQISTLVLGVGATGDAVYRLGGTRQDAEGRVTTFSGGLDLVKGPDGIEFFGPTAKYAIVGPDLDDGRPFIDTPDAGGSLVDLVSATIHVAMRQSPDDLAALTRTANVFNGFAAGMVEKVGLTDTPIGYRSSSSTDLILETNPGNNTIGGVLTVRDVPRVGFAAGLDPDLESIKVAYGDGIGGNDGNDGPSAMVDDSIFAAGPNPTATETVVTEDAGPTSTSPTSAATGTYVVSGAAVGNVMPNGRTPCSACDFMKWGYWGTKPNFDNATVPVEANVHLGTWAGANKIAKEDVAGVEIPPSGTATYNGDVWGDVTKTVAGNVQRYTASGDLNMTWDFATRDGQLNINNFDGLNITSGPGGMTAVNGPGTGSPAEFDGNLTDGASLAGSASGAFALGPLNPGSLATPQGVIGAFDVNGTVSGDPYSAAGSFIGAQ